MYFFVEERGIECEIGGCFEGDDSPDEGYDKFALWMHLKLYMAR